MKERKKKAQRRRLILLILLGLAVTAAAYYLLVYRVVEEDIRSIRQERMAVESELLLAQEKAERMDQMEAELITIRSKNASRMESYNNTKQELYMLNRILKNTRDYSVSFQKVTRDGDQIRRTFSMDFTVNSYVNAMEVVRQLQNNPYRCVLGNIAYSRTENTDTHREQVRISLDGTFFETMVGGTPDAGLPAAAASDAG